MLRRLSRVLAGPGGAGAGTGSGGSSASSSSAGSSNGTSRGAAAAHGEGEPFLERYQKLKKRDGFTDEYARARANADHQPGYRERITPPSEDAQRKNRYRDVVCLDDTRVRLRWDGAQPTDGKSDYINASCVRGASGKLEYIAAQAPLPFTLDDFWEMCWEHDVRVVLMLTPFEERKRKKAEPYFPLATADPEMRMGDFSVRCSVAQEVEDGLVLRRLSVRLGRTGEERTVVHVHFTAWPDFGCVSDFGGLLRLLDTVDDALVKGFKEPPVPPKAPLIVHCSAGIGRSGTYIAIDILRKQLLNARRLDDTAVHHVDVPSVVTALRNQRPGMVMTPAQYEMVYDVLAFWLSANAAPDATAHEANLAAAAIASTASPTTTSRSGISGAASDEDRYAQAARSYRDGL